MFSWSVVEILVLNIICRSHHKRPPRFTFVGRNAPNMCAHPKLAMQQSRQIFIVGTYLTGHLASTFNMSEIAVNSQPLMNGAHFNGDVAIDYDMHGMPRDGPMRFTSGLILPPPEIKCKHNFYCIKPWLTKHSLHSCHRQNCPFRCSFCQSSSV